MTTLEEIQSMMTPCRSCGELYVPDRGDVFGVSVYGMPDPGGTGDFLDGLLANMKVIAETPFRKCNTLGWTCDACMEHSRAERLRMERERRETVAQELSYGTGLMPFSAARCIWSLSLGSVDRRYEKQYRALREWDGRRWVWIQGETGRGKTWAARAMLNARISEGDRCAEVSGVALADALFARDTKRYDACRIILVDDVSGQRWTDDSVQMLANWIASLHDGNTTLVMTSQVPYEDWLGDLRSSKYLGQAIKSRLSSALKVNLSGESLR